MCVRWIALCLALLTVPPAFAASGGEQGRSLTAVDQVILPGHAVLIEAASNQQQSVEALCAMPGTDTLERARADFDGLVAAFSRIEFIRFGPARTDFRAERLFFWPDRRGRGLKQVQALLKAADAGALSGASLYEKSVAVQGLPALEYVLFGEGAGQLGRAGDPLRCRYALAIAANVVNVAGALQADWIAPDGHRARMAAPAGDNAVYRSQAEVLRTLLDAGREQLQLVIDGKLARPLGESIERARPKRAPLWRSGNDLPSVIANIEGLIALFASLKSDDETRSDNRAADVLIGSLLIELGSARDAIVRARHIADGQGSAYELAQARELLEYAVIPLGGALDVLSESLPGAFGLIAGFNALDGD
ncbi:imelysin family protein [Minwuia sp.]|uniref:imelysin family protein n=1 Tax=Minwuia sp. TaxID=2493630 RepID=UPI003A8FAD85